MDNHVTILGLVSREPTFYDEEKPRLKMVVKLHREWISKRDNESRSKDSYFDVVCFGDLALGCKELRYGDEILLTGKLNQRTIQSDDGNKHSLMEIAADHVGRSL